MDPHPINAARPRKPVVLVGTILAVALALGGCSLFGGKKLDLACPKVGILRDAGQITLFRPGFVPSGQNTGANAVAAKAVVGDYTGTCTYDETGVTVNVSLALVGERGPALAGNQAPLSYFVAVAKPDGTIAAKQVFATTLDFPGNVPRAGSREDLQPHIPLPKGQDARGYQILVGFQLTPDQLAYNRRTGIK